MSKIISNPKSYTGKELDTIFFRPLATGADMQALGFRIMYNTPVPVTLNYWGRSGDVLKKYQKGWQGGSLANKYQKTIALNKVKAEMSYSAEDYFGMIYELITNRSDVNLDSLSGTDLEKAEIQLFQHALLEDLRITSIFGDFSKYATTPAYNSFTGFLTRIIADTTAGGADTPTQVEYYPVSSDPDAAISLFSTMWEAAPAVLKAMKGQNSLAFYVTSDIYENYEKALEGTFLETAFAALKNGQNGLTWHGIRIIDLGVTEWMKLNSYPVSSFAFLTDKRNVALALNTNYYPGMEARMWYNPDEMENRQRTIFMAGADYLLPELIVFAKEIPLPEAPTGGSET
ncbi:MAG: hypothetical protein LBJ63_04865 [Prevotellaceae bacterium]|jgi:hypothetical protein|nr:hypothetical protein [Prevotellaceae bacterium]